MRRSAFWSASANPRPDARGVRRRVRRRRGSVRRRRPARARSRARETDARVRVLAVRTRVIMRERSRPSTSRTTLQNAQRVAQGGRRLEAAARRPVRRRDRGGAHRRVAIGAFRALRTSIAPTCVQLRLRDLAARDDGDHARTQLCRGARQLFELALEVARAGRRPARRSQLAAQHRAGRVLPRRIMRARPSSTRRSSRSAARSTTRMRSPPRRSAWRPSPIRAASTPPRWASYREALAVYEKPRPRCRDRPRRGQHRQRAVPAGGVRCGDGIVSPRPGAVDRRFRPAGRGAGPERPRRACTPRRAISPRRSTCTARCSPTRAPA